MKCAPERGVLERTCDSALRAATWGSSKKSNVRSVLQLLVPVSERYPPLTAHIGEEAGEQSDCGDFPLLKATFSTGRFHS